MNDLVDVLTKREKEIADFIAQSKKEHETLINRLGELDNLLNDAERDIDRIRRARSVLEEKVESCGTIENTIDKLMPLSKASYPYR